MEKRATDRGDAAHLSSLRTTWPALWVALYVRLRKVSLAGALIASSMFMTATPAQAADGCTVLLCIAGNWKNVAECVPPVREALRDLARGRGWPSCDMAGAGNSGIQTWATEATCPPMYSNYDADNSRWVSCTYPGIINITMNGAPWSRVFFSFGGESSTFYTATAKAQLGTFIDTTYDTDQAAWDAAHQDPPPCEPKPRCDGGGGS